MGALHQQIAQVVDIDYRAVEGERLRLQTLGLQAQRRNQRAKVVVGTAACTATGSQCHQVADDVRHRPARVENTAQRGGERDIAQCRGHLI